MSNIAKSSLKVLASQTSRCGQVQFKIPFCRQFLFQLYQAYLQIHLEWMDLSQSHVNTNISLAQFEFKYVKYHLGKPLHHKMSLN